MKKVLVVIGVCFFGLGVTSLSALTNLQAPLAERILTEDGDLVRVPIWVWANSLTGDKAAIVLNQTGELDAFKLHRTWRRGQTVGQAMRSAEDYLGRFRVHFERETLTLISLSAEDALKKNGSVTGYSGWSKEQDAVTGPYWKIGIGGGASLDADPFTAIDVFAPLTRGLDVVLRSDIYIDYVQWSEFDNYYYYEGNFGLSLGVRATANHSGVFSPFIQAGISLFSSGSGQMDNLTQSYTLPSEKTFGIMASGGIRVGSLKGLMLSAEVAIMPRHQGYYTPHFFGTIIFCL